MDAVKILLATVLVGLVLVGGAQAAHSPARSATAARDCLLARGWTATLADHGTTVNGKAPRRLATYPWRPLYSVTFIPQGSDRPTWAEFSQGLTRGETRVAVGCRTVGLRHR